MQACTALQVSRQGVPNAISYVAQPAVMRLQKAPKADFHLSWLTLCTFAQTESVGTLRLHGRVIWASMLQQTCQMG